MSMINVLREKEDFQRLILDELSNSNGYIERGSSNFSKDLAMDKELVLKFLNDTQPEKIEKLKRIYKENTNETIINKLNNEIIKEKGGILNVLKEGVWFENSIQIDFMIKKPATNLNIQHVESYNKNILSVMEEVWHTDKERIDLVIFLNGLAIISFELKCNTSGQNYEDAINQYKHERDYKSRLLKFKSGCIVNFAMDLNEVYMCSNLKGRESYFLPFNKGSDDFGKGNPHNKDGVNVSYMWEDILKKDNLLFLIDKLIFVEKKEDKSKKGKYTENLIFPRYHQMDAIRNLMVDILDNETSLNYLIQHSAGSGKTYTISWLAHALSSLHKDGDNKIFDKILIITDRIVVDRQLQNAVMGIKHAAGKVRIMDDKCTANDLADVLNGNTSIVVSTIQKFRYITDAVSNMKSKKFAIIIDEAHSSTSGSYMEGLGLVVSAEEDDIEDVDEILAKHIERNGKQPNVSMIAFTATPKPTTLKMFGRDNPQGHKEAFSLYSMKQAIEEGFILDVLQNYVTYETYFELNKTIDDDPEISSIEGKRKLARFIELHETNISQKVEIIIEHFKEKVMYRLGGTAKAMVVTSSRESAVKYKEEFEKYIKRCNYTDIHALVAFSGKVSMNGNEYTEIGLNGFSEDKLVKEFDKDSYQVLLVANKYQTGFDQPKLSAMYVDKILKDVAAVQTLSRLNRICPPYTKSTFVLDFRNTYENIQKSFAPYYKGVVLGEDITVSQIYALEEKLDNYQVLDYDVISNFNDLLVKEKLYNKDKNKMWSLLDSALTLIKKNDKEVQLEIKSTIKNFIRFYSFLIQVSHFTDIDLHKKYNYLTYLVKEIDITNGSSSFDIRDKVELINLVHKKTNERTSSEYISTDVINLPKADNPEYNEDKQAKLSEIINEMNSLTGKDINKEVASDGLKQVRNLIEGSNELVNIAKNNNLSDFSLAYFEEVEDMLADGAEQNREFFNSLLNNDELRKKLFTLIMEDIYTSLRKK